MQIDPHQKEFSLRFSGNATEYFGIWLLNTALTIATLGIYGAWAKVRREQYFLSHTWLDQSNFQYTGNPIKILKGRLVAMALVLVLAILGAVIPFFALISIIPFLVLYPFFFVQAIRFRARYTAYRGIHFSFKGTALRAAFIKYVIKPISLMLIFFYPFASFKERRFIVDNLRFGTTEFLGQFRLRSFYACYIGAILIPLFLAFILVGINHGSLPSESTQPSLLEIFLTLLLGVVTAAATLFVYFRLRKLTWDRAQLGNYTIHYRPCFLPFAWITLSNIALIILTLGLATPIATVRLYRYRTEQLSLSGPEDLSLFLGEAQSKINSLGDELSDFYDFDIDFGI